MEQRGDRCIYQTDRGGIMEKAHLQDQGLEGKETRSGSMSQSNQYSMRRSLSAGRQTSIDAHFLFLFNLTVSAYIHSSK